MSCAMLHLRMIESFKHKGLQRLYETGDRRGIRTDIAKKAELYLSILDTASTVKNLDITGFGLHRLKGKLRGFYSVSVSRNHRIIFRFEEGQVFDVDLVDYKEKYTMPMKHPAHPGKVIKHALDAAGLTVTEAAERLGVTRQTLSRVVNEKTGVSVEMAIRVSKAFGSTPEHWLKMQLAYDLVQMQNKAASIKVKRVPEVEPLPV